MNLRQLEIFSAVMRFRTTVAAAQELSMSQPAVSNAIKHIETQLGFRLFERVGNRLVPTEEANDPARGGGAAGSCISSGQPARQRSQGRRASAGSGDRWPPAELSESILPGAMMRFLEQKKHPSVHLSLDTRPLASVLRRRRNGPRRRRIRDGRRIIGTR